MSELVRPRVPPTVADVRDHYDELDRPYREIWGEHVHHGYWRTGQESPEQAAEALSDLVLGRLAIAPGQHIGDIGCGYGATARHILKRHDVQITGYTVSPMQAQFALQECETQGNFTCVLGDWLANGLPDCAFDRLYAIESSEHFDDKAGFFSEAARTLRPGGRLVVCAWLTAEAPGPLAIRHLLEPICREGALPGMDSRSGYERLAAGAGLRLMRFDDVSANVRRTWSIVGRRLAGRLLTDAGYRQLAFDPSVRSRAFLLSVPRLWLALRSGAMRYGIFVWRKPQLAKEERG